MTQKACSIVSAPPDEALVLWVVVVVFEAVVDCEEGGLMVGMRGQEDRAASPLSAPSCACVDSKREGTHGQIA